MEEIITHLFISLQYSQIRGIIFIIVIVPRILNHSQGSHSLRL